MREEARAELTAAANGFADTLGVDIARITVRETRSRWGSCAANGALSFSWRLICAPPAVLTYVAAHEVAHLIERNHSARFWAVVDRLVGDPKAEKDWLKHNAAALFAIGAEPLNPAGPCR